MIDVTSMFAKWIHIQGIFLKFFCSAACRARFPGVCIHRVSSGKDDFTGIVCTNLITVQKP